MAGPVATVNLSEISIPNARGPMTATENEDRLAEMTRLGKQTYYSSVLPKLRPEDDQKYAAVDVDTGEFETDQDELAAVDRLRARVPAARIWMMQVGYDTAYRIRRTAEVAR